MNKIRKFLACVICMFAVSGAHAGVPVFDGAAVLNLVTQYQQMMQQYTTMKSQLSTANNQLDAMKGSRGMGTLLTDPSMQSHLPKDWAKVMGQVRSTGTYSSERAKFPTVKDAKVNAIYDSMATNNATMVEYFKLAGERLETVAKLQGAIDTAEDPAAKADLQSRIISEQNAIAGTSQLLAILKEKQAQEVIDARQDAHRKYICAEFKKNCP
ncbi:type IV secretion system protein [Massilia sp. CCM 9210]|uniref:type IV secretion system protein n=1 Tax=Massilia scottii TaxID=3057166 RepID=UPI002796A836|nr:type IV secretion system protein [Massilia sp. CCM 9210]MDQ1817821.1 type IV secretion system protein [Massilia sp. CCM 9210]